MKLITKAIAKKAQAQFPKGSDMTQLVVAKFFDPCGSWSWYLMNQDPDDPDYLWGIVKGSDVVYCQDCEKILYHLNGEVIKDGG
jgi:hypothetical protein